MRKTYLGALAFVGLLWFVDSGAYGLGDKEPDIRGVITTVHKIPGLLGMVLVEEKGGEPNEKIWARVNKDTKIFKHIGKDRKAATYEDLKVGVRIDARFDKDILHSDPPQAMAVEIVILDDNEPDIRGVITKAREIKGTLGQFFVEGKSRLDYGKIWVGVAKDTKIFKLDGKDRNAATFADVKVGARIEARFNGRVAESAPPQTTAVEIVILPAEKR